MRIPWPDHLNMKGVLFFAILQTAAELLLGTSPVFALGVFYYVMVAAVAFNIAGGLDTFAGSYIGFLSLETILIAQVAKIILLQPADSHLVAPTSTIANYDAGITALLLAVFIASKYRRKKRPIFNTDNDGDRIVGMSMVSSLIGLVAILLVGMFGFAEDLSIQKGGLLGMLNQFGAFAPLGVLLGTASIIQRSEGTRSAKWWTILPIVLLTLAGVAVESKQGIFQPVLMWLLVCAAYRYKLNRTQVISLIAAAAFSAYLIFPVVQYMRGSTRTGDLFNRGRLVYEYLSDNNIMDIRENYFANEELREESSAAGYFYFGTDKGVLDRISLIEMDDAIIYRTEVSIPRGAKPLMDGVLMDVPRFLWPDKAKWEAGTIASVNEMGREIGLLAPSDESTYIAFSVFGSTFFMVGWLSAPLILAVMAPTIIILDAFYGNVKTNMFALFVVLGNMHGGPEFTLPAAFSLIVHLVVLAWITIVFIRFVSPAVTIFLNRRGLLDQHSAPRLAAVRTAPGRD